MTAILLAALTIGAPVPKELKKADESTRLLGKWESVKADYDLKPGAAGAVFRFDTDGAGGVTPPGGASGEISAKYALDSTTSPKRFEWTLNGGGAMVATYELDGDVLKIAFGANGKQPPAAAPAAGVSFYEMRRIPSDK